MKYRSSIGKWKPQAQYPGQGTSVDTSFGSSFGSFVSAWGFGFGLACPNGCSTPVLAWKKRGFQTGNNLKRINWSSNKTGCIPYGSTPKIGLITNNGGITSNSEKDIFRYNGLVIGEWCTNMAELYPGNGQRVIRSCFPPKKRKLPWPDSSHGVPNKKITKQQN